MSTILLIAMSSASSNAHSVFNNSENINFNDKSAFNNAANPYPLAPPMESPPTNAINAPLCTAPMENFVVNARPFTALMENYITVRLDPTNGFPIIPPEFLTLAPKGKDRDEKDFHHFTPYLLMLLYLAKWPNPGGSFVVPSAANVNMLRNLAWE